MNILQKINNVGDRIFLNPTPLLSYEYLAKNSLASNTYRGFHRIDKCQPGASQIFEGFLLSNKQDIIKELNNISSEKELDQFADSLCDSLSHQLKVNIKDHQLTSYNKLRKPIDIIIEHMVSMGKDFANHRNALIPFLYLPLDSQMFKCNFVFSDSEIKELEIRRTFSFKNIKSKEHYQKIQNFLKQKISNEGVNSRIYLDLIWNKRYESSGTNLFLTNPK